MLQISISEEDAGMLRQVLDAKRIDLRREISHTDSPRFRATLEQLEAALDRLLQQLPVVPTDAPSLLDRGER